jgi:hypothetical protein
LIRSRRWYWATPLVFLAACRPDAPTTPPPSLVPSVVAVVSGDQQHADPQDILPDPVIFRVSDATGRPMKGVTVQFAVPIGGGSVPMPTKVTDSIGVVSTSWAMGAQGGVQALEAHVNAVPTATATATTCDPADCFPPAQLSSTLSDATLLTLATYDSSGQAVHPDVVRGHGTATGFWLAITPYPGGNVKYENPSLFHSRDAKTWVVPAGSANPLVLPDSSAYLSDPAILVNKDQRLWLYYRSVINSQNVIKVIRSGDGLHWDGATDVVSVPSHQLVSPAVVRNAPHAPWQMWSVNAGPQGCSAPLTTIERRTSGDGLNWSAPGTVNLVQPGEAIWHIDVQWIPARSEYWALYNTYPTGTTCATNKLFLARSADGVTWTTYPSPIATIGVISAFKHIIYRSTFMTNPKATTVTLWMSGASYGQQTGYTWQTATVSTAVVDLLAMASSPAVTLRAVPFFGSLPPPEPDEGPGGLTETRTAPSSARPRGTAFPHP